MNIFFVNDSSSITELLKSEFVKKLVEKLMGVATESSANELLHQWVQKIDLKKLLIAEACVFVFMLLLRSYIFTKCKTFWGHFIGEIWTITVYLCLSLFFIPLFLFGFEYIDFIKIIFNIFTGIADKPPSL